jgi:hypothetical protein
MSLEPVHRVLASEGDDLVWELFHENSKTSMVERHPIYGLHPNDAVVVTMMKALRTVKRYTDRPKVPLPASFPRATPPLDQVLSSPAAAPQFGAGGVPV